MQSWWSNPHHERIGGVRQTAPTAWVPEEKPIWFTELGCAAIDKGTNQPNKFLDPKSSESDVPHFSNGRRDDLIQMQYLRAMLGFWEDPANNPTSALYGAPMIDTARSHVWAWDARPFPFFPNNTTIWSDGGNYAHGHWLNGRTSARPLASVVAEICERSGVSDFDVSGLFGLVRGYSVADIGDARAALQPLMLAYGFDAVERDGVLIFKNRDGVTDTEIMPEALAVSPELAGDVEAERAPEADIAGRVRLNFVAAEGDYEVHAVEAIFPDDSGLTVSQSELPLALTKAEGQGAAERWLSEARIARDTLRFALPPSSMAVGAGDVVDLDHEGGVGSFRIDRVEQSAYQLIEAVRVEPDIYVPSTAVEETTAVRAFSAPVPPFPLFLDLPLITGDEIPHAPRLAVTSNPWPGTVAVYSSATGSGYRQNTLIPKATVIGVTQTPLFAAIPGVWDRGLALRVKLSGGSLASAPEDAVLAGANLAAIGDGSSDNWEVFQFTEAELVGADTYNLRLRLRGQAGSDALMPPDWPAGSMFVLLDGTSLQIDLPPTARNLVRYYRIGPAQRPVDDPAFVERIEAFAGIGLRPYAPAHLRAERDAVGDLAVRWVRRTRIDGDAWSPADVPLGEAFEAYQLRVLKNGQIRRDTTMSSPFWTYPQAMQAADGVSAPFEIEVAQVSDRFGPGPFRRIVTNG